MLTFAIPTWNRAEKLRVCIGSILEQIDTLNFPAKIVVSDNASDDRTHQILQAFKERFPGYVSFRTLDRHVGANENFASAFTMPDTEWTWTFGDDDRLAPGALERLWPLLKRDLSFIHVTERTRASGNHGVHVGSFSDLSNVVGFVEFSGFISGNVVKTEVLKRAFTSKNIDVYGRSAFAQCLALMEAASNGKSALVDAPLVELQDENQTDDTLRRWGDENIAMRYVAIADGLTLLRDNGVIPSTVPLEFFRYQQGNLFGKIMLTFWECVQHKSELPAEIEWERLFTLASLLEDEAMTKTIEKFRADLEEYCVIASQGLVVIDRLSRGIEASQPFRYPFTYV